MTTDEKKKIVEKAFKRLQKHFGLPIAVEQVTPGTYDPEAISILYSYTYPDQNKKVVNSYGMGAYWFNNTLYIRTCQRYGGMNKDVDQLVPKDLGKDEETMAILRIAAEFYLECKRRGWIK